MDDQDVASETGTQSEERGAPASAQPLEDNQFHVSDVPGDGGLLVADVVAVFAVEKRLCATQARCTHMGGPLEEGTLVGSVITCPWHGAQFDVCTGAVVRGPAVRPLELYTLHVQGDVGELDVE